MLVLVGVLVVLVVLVGVDAIFVFFDFFLLLVTPSLLRICAL